jgi:hypothetical protein
MVSGIGALSWLAFTNPAFLVPERWSVLFGIFASIFAGYFVLATLRRYKFQAAVMTVILGAFAMIGVAYAVMPYDAPFVLMATTKPYIEDFMPITMQFNALDVDDNHRLIFTIDEINNHTEPDAVIVGAKHWRGFMQIYLTDERIYRFSDDPQALGLSYAQQGSNVYLLAPVENSEFGFTKIEDSART